MNGNKGVSTHFTVTYKNTVNNPSVAIGTLSKYKGLEHILKFTPKTGLDLSIYISSTSSTSFAGVFNM